MIWGAEWAGNEPLAQVRKGTQKREVTCPKPGSSSGGSGIGTQDFCPQAYLLHCIRGLLLAKPQTGQGFPGGAVVENLPANVGDTGSSPGLGRSHMSRSSWAREPQLLSLHVWSLCSATREAAIVRGPRTAMKSGPRLPQLEKALAQKRRPNTAINK